MVAVAVNALVSGLETPARAQRATGYGSGTRKRLAVLNEPLPAEVQGTETPEAELEAEIRARNLSLSESAAAEAAKLVIDSDTLTDEPYMIAIVAATVVMAAAMTSGVIGAVAASSTPVLSAAAAVAATVAGILFSDAFTGVFHWSVDNYGNLQTPVLGPVIAAFQGHHESPWTITYRNFANNVHKVAYGVLPLLGLLALSHPGPAGTMFGVSALMGLLMCQELHKYSHMVRPPQWVARLQQSGIILSKKEHGLHHTSPFEGKYCIVTGHCNEIMDSTNLYRHLERVVYERTGVEPNCWKLDTTGEIKAAALGTST
ncbi:Kua-ubiquitin conjugating enzyme hybrid localization domain-containing protein [Tribonema minus]|uniref:Kua-ubiquitin conjugating enzyme hybrid localization domain-containing protein n=1 Tax=Tribonema minus TaxID=303371 RepID=A0A835ZEB7_9STRA|nr:Kua-ubiquitin conjugating enzyme hybrid localization domain-containing protein [Tribonema minus]